MKKFFFLFVLFSFAISMLAFENDSLLKRQKIKFYLGIGINTNMFKTDNFHYYYTSSNRDAVTEDLDIKIYKTYSPFLELSIVTKILENRKVKINSEINDMIWICKERYDAQGTKSIDITAPEYIEKKSYSEFISNYLGVKTSFLSNSSQNKFGFFIGAGLNYVIYNRSKTEVSNLTYKYGYIDKHEDFNDNLKFTFAVSPGLEAHYKIGKINLRSQFFSMAQVFQNNLFSFRYFKFNTRNYLLFFSTSIAI